MDMRPTYPVVFVSISIVIIKIEEMPCLRVPEQMPGKQPSFVKCGLDLIGSLLSGWLNTLRYSARLPLFYSLHPVRVLVWSLFAKYGMKAYLVFDFSVNVIYGFRK